MAGFRGTGSDRESLQFKGVKMIRESQIHTVTTHYLHALLWTAPCNETEENPGDNLDVSDLSQSIYDDAMKDCREFIEACGELFQQAMNCHLDGYGQHPDAGSAEAAFGYDFALTRNGHGVGFWDRESEGLPRELGDKITALCENREKNLIINPDGSIYYE